MWETWVQSLGWEDPLEKGTATHYYSGLENSTDCIAHAVAKRWTQLSDFHFQFEASLMAQTVKNLPAMLEDLSSMLNIALYAIQ